MSDARRAQSTASTSSDASACADQTGPPLSEESLEKLRKTMGMTPTEANGYQEIQAYREGKPAEVLGALPILDEFIEMKTQANSVRIDQMLMLDESRRTQSLTNDPAKTSAAPTKQAKIFGMDDSDLAALQKHRKAALVFGDAPPAAALSDQVTDLDMYRKTRKPQMLLGDAVPPNAFGTPQQKPQ